MVELRSLSVSYPVPARWTLGRRRISRIEALSPCTVRFERGDITAIIGPSGCGKTSLIRAMAGLLAPRSGNAELRGDILIEGQPLKGVRRKTACVFQDFGLLPWKTVRANAELPLLIAGLPLARRREKIAALLGEFGLAGFAGLYPRQLSGGMKQRLALVRALAAEPDLLLMDEPFSSLDALSREEAQDFLLELRQKYPLTVILVTHSVEEAAYLAGHVCVIAGKNPGSLIAREDIRRGNRSRAGSDFSRICADLRALLRKK